MNNDEASGSARIMLGLILAAACVTFSLFAQPAYGQAEASSNAPLSGTLAHVHSDQRVVQNGRWFLVRQFTVDFAVADAAHSYCGEIITTDSTEAHDLISSGGQTVDVQQHGKELYLTLKDGRKLRTHRISENQCPRT